MDETKNPVVLTSQEARVIGSFKQRPVQQVSRLRDKLSVSRMTVFRALQKHGHFQSFNHHARFCTLQRTPRFDAKGLWFFHSIGFSSHGTLANTAVALVTSSHAGLTPSELSCDLLTRVTNLLPALARQGKLARRRLGRQTVFLAADSDRLELQWQHRREPQPQFLVPGPLTHDLLLGDVLPVLTELIRSPDASTKQLAAALKAQGLSLPAGKVQLVLDRFDLDDLRGSLRVVEILQELSQQQQDLLRQATLLPQLAVFTFDQLAQLTQPGQPLPPIVKTKKRRVVSLRFGHLRVREVLRRAERPKHCRPSGLERLVGKGLRYGYDLIVHVGLEYHLHARGLKQIQEGLLQRHPAIWVPISSLSEMCSYFLYLLGRLHAKNASRLVALLAEQGKSVWLMDCTREEDGPTFFGILETCYGIMLGVAKVATENETNLAGCTRRTVRLFGKPGRLLHDLSPAMIALRNQELGDVPDGVCHYHFARDIGSDLLEQAQKKLSDRLQAMKLKSRMHEQRKEQSRYLRKRQSSQETDLLLARLLAGEEATKWMPTLGREVLLAVQYWILDYGRDGKRQGYPFDPPLLYQHRRLVRAANMLQRLTAHRGSAKLPRCLLNLKERLVQYRDDPEIVEAATQYEQAYEVFEQVRQALRLSGQGKTPMSDRYVLEQAEQGKVQESLKDLCFRYEQKKETSQAEQRRLYEVVLSHVQRYQDKLFYESSEKLNQTGTRTTNQLEQQWREFKRKCRRHHGNANLSREMIGLPAEVLLVANLKIPEYVQAVIGSLEELPQRLAELGGKAKSFARWKAEQQPQQAGQLPRRVLRRGDFLCHLLEVCLPLDK